MTSSNDEKTEVADKTRRKSSLLSFAHPLAGRTQSSGTVHTRRDSVPTDSEAIEDGEPDPRKMRPLARSRSEDATPRVREQWGCELWNQGALQKSMALLQSSVMEYEQKASEQQWKDLLMINADVADLGKLADGARKKKAKQGKEDESMDGLSKFSTVAIEYSKMLDVVMNQSPEYAGLAWGVRVHQTWRSPLTLTGDTNAAGCPHEP
jgi:hypothetical protein